VVVAGNDVVAVAVVHGVVAVVEDNDVVVAVAHDVGVLHTPR
jgi:hypothetical protein